MSHFAHTKEGNACERLTNISSQDDEDEDACELLELLLLLEELEDELEDEGEADDAPPMLGLPTPSSSTRGPRSKTEYAIWLASLKLAHDVCGSNPACIATLAPVTL